MKALVSSAAGPEQVTAPEPEPGPGQALVEVRAAGVNRGELALMAMLPAGSRLGWDVAGTVIRAAADGSGPAEGSRVLALADRDGWAERIAVGTDRLVELPDDLGFEDAATLPVVGLTGMYAVQYAGPLLGRSVVVTGAGGALGRVLVQLASAAGAEVTALVGSPARGEGLAELGATTVATYEEGTKEGAPKVDVVLDSVGGEVLTGVFKRLGPGGTLVCFGNTTREELRLPMDWGHARPGLNVRYLHLFDEITRRDIAADLAAIVRLTNRGLLRPQLAVTTPWTDPGPALAAITERRANGKVVLTF